MFCVTESTCAHDGFAFTLLVAVQTENKQYYKEEGE